MTGYVTRLLPADQTIRRTGQPPGRPPGGNVQQWMPRPAPSTPDPSRSCPPGFVRSSLVLRRCVPTPEPLPGGPTAKDIRCHRWRAPTPVLPSHGRLRAPLLRHVQQVSAAARRVNRAADGLARRVYRALFGGTGAVSSTVVSRCRETQGTRFPGKFRGSKPPLPIALLTSAVLSRACRVIFTTVGVYPRAGMP